MKTPLSSAAASSNTRHVTRWPHHCLHAQTQTGMTVCHYPAPPFSLHPAPTVSRQAQPPTPSCGHQRPVHAHRVPDPHAAALRSGPRLPSQYAHGRTALTTCSCPRLLSLQLRRAQGVVRPRKQGVQVGITGPSMGKTPCCVASGHSGATRESCRVRS